MGRALIMAVPLACYAAFFASFVYLIGWVGGFEFMPTHVDKGLENSAGTALIVNITLIALFGYLSEQDRPAEATPEIRHAWERQVVRYGADDFQVSAMTVDIAEAMARSGRRAEARNFLEERLAQLESDATHRSPLEEALLGL